MTERQKRFCDAYLANGGNATQAAIEAGYSEKYAGQNADKLLKNTNCAKYLSEQTKSIHNSKIATAEEVLAFLTKVAAGSEKEIVVASSGRVVEVPVSMQNRMKAADMLLKAHGSYSQNVNIKGSVPVVITGSDELED